MTGVAEGGAAGVPTEMVELVAGAGHVEPADHLRVVSRTRLDVDDGKRVGPGRAVAVEGGDIGQLFGRGGGGVLRRAVEGGVGTGCRPFGTLGPVIGGVLGHSRISP